MGAGQQSGRTPMKAAIYTMYGSLRRSGIWKKGTLDEK
jgi:hypothetical protein